MHSRKIEEIIDFCEELTDILTPDTEYDQLSDDDMENIDAAYELIKGVYDSVFYNVDQEENEFGFNENFSIENFLLDGEYDLTEKLDPVGKEDSDIDNDGDVDDSDEYLHRRRKAIRKAIKNTKEK